MITTPGWLSTSISFLIALLVGVLLGSVVQTQINLAALQGMGVQIPAMLDTTVNDLLTFAPLYALLFSVGFIFSQTAAVRLSRWLGGRFQALLSAGAAAVLMTPLKAYPGTVSPCHRCWRGRPLSPRPVWRFTPASCFPSGKVIC